MQRRVLPALLAPFAAPAVARAQGFPSRPVRLVLPYAPGGAVDIIGRAAGTRFAELLGQPFVIENRAGAGGTVGAEAVARSAPDGHTLLLTNPAQVGIARALSPRLGYDPAALTPVTLLAETPQALFAATASGIGDVGAALAAARARPGAVAVGTPGQGSFGHLLLELLTRSAGVSFLHIPYRGATLVLNDMAAGTVPLTFTTVASAKGLLDSGTVRGLAVASDRRTAGMPEVPTFAEAGIAGMAAPLWFGITAPPGTPDEIVATLHRAFAASLATEEVRGLMARVGADIVAGGPDRLRRAMDDDLGRWDAVVRAANIRLE